MQAPRPTPYALRSMWLPLLSTFIALFSLLLYVHTLPSSPLKQAVTALNADIHPTDGVIMNDPEATIPFAELYKGRAPVLGLNNGGLPLPNDVTRRLSETADQHEQVWWLPNWLPPEESAIAQTLLVSGFQARNDSFDWRRLGLFAFPANLVDQSIPIRATFGESIVLNQVAYPPVISPGTALPIELQWQTTVPVAEDYHVFIHLLAQDGQMLAQADGQPVHWTRPTTSWEPGETIIDRYGLWLPPEVKPGDYHLSIGLYRPADGQRLYLPDGKDSLQLKVTVL